MNPTEYVIHYNGKCTTIRTCGGPVGAFSGFTGISPRLLTWQYINERDTIINGCLVRRL